MPLSVALLDSIMYLQEFDVSGLVIFCVDVFLSLHLQIMNLFLQCLLPELSLVSFPLTLPQVLFPVWQLKQNASIHSSTCKNYWNIIAYC